MSVIQCNYVIFCIKHGKAINLFPIEKGTKCSLEPQCITLWIVLEGENKERVIPEPTARSAVPGVSPGRGLLIVR